jgi:hypothetical protein
VKLPGANRDAVLLSFSDAKVNYMIMIIENWAFRCDSADIFIVYLLCNKTYFYPSRVSIIDKKLARFKLEW